MNEWFFPKALVKGQIAHNVRVESQDGIITAAVSYTHLTLPTILLV